MKKEPKPEDTETCGQGNPTPKADTCDYCGLAAAVMHFWRTNKNACAGCSGHAKREAQELAV